MTKPIENVAASPLVGEHLEFWSGARDLNPGPHGPEPCRCRVLRCPTDSCVVLANTESARLVPFDDPLESHPVPGIRDTAVIRRRCSRPLRFERVARGLYRSL